MFQFFQKSITAIGVNELNELLNKINLIDIREPSEYRSGHLPKAKNIPMDKIISETDIYLDKETEYHIICQSGMRSSRTCKILKKKGFNIINVAGGTGGYRGNLEKL